MIRGRSGPLCQEIGAGKEGMLVPKQHLGSACDTESCTWTGQLPPLPADEAESGFFDLLHECSGARTPAYVRPALQNEVNLLAAQVEPRGDISHGYSSKSNKHEGHVPSSCGSSGTCTCEAAVCKGGQSNCSQCVRTGFVNGKTTSKADCLPAFFLSRSIDKTCPAF